MQQRARRSSSYFDELIRCVTLQGEQVRLFEGHTSFVFCLAYNPQSSLLVSGSFDETIRLWDVRKGELLLFESVRRCCMGARH